MIEIVWEFVVKEKAQGQFELAYGPGGAWSKLFAKGLGFLGTTLLHDTKNPRRYLVIDLWDTLAQREQIPDSAVKRIFPSIRCSQCGSTLLICVIEPDNKSCCGHRVEVLIPVSLRICSM